MDIAKIIADNLTDWMNSTPALDTFKKLSTKSGVGFGTVQRAKNGDGNITVEKLAAIAQAFGRAPADLLLPETSAEQGKPAAAHQPPSLDTKDGGTRDALPLQLSPDAERLVDLVSLIDQLGGAKDVLGAAETLLRRTLPSQGGLAYGPPGLQSLFEQYTKDSASLTPDAISTLSRHLARAVGTNTSQEKQDGQRDQSEDTGT